MKISRCSYLMLSALLAWASCSEQQATTPPCGAKCDSPAAQAQQVSEPLMQKAPPGESSISRTKDGQWLFHTIGARGEIVLHSQTYVQRASAANGILSVEENGVDLDQYRIVKSVAGTYRVSLRAKNNVEIATSRSFASFEEAYAAKHEARDLIAAILRFKAEVEHGARFDLARDEFGQRQWHFTLLDEDGTALLHSQRYQRRTGAVNGIQSVRENGKLADRYVFLNGAFSYILKAKNGQEIARSAIYRTAAEAEAGAENVRQLLQSERVANPW